MRTFFEVKQTTPNKPELPPCLIQLPSPKDIEGMKGMPAGLYEDQSERLKHMAQTIQEMQPLYPELAVVTTDDVDYPIYWLRLFEAIQKGNKKKAWSLLDEIPANDCILLPLLQVHPKDYLKKIIGFCITAQVSKKYSLEHGDVVITPTTFEILIKDLACTLFHPAKAFFSFGLPSHHAYSEKPKGFCIFNKTAVLLRHLELTQPSALNYMIIGTDVNRDNGLCNIVMQKSSHLSICHIDVFDSRVYPGQNNTYINEEFDNIGLDCGNKIQCWQKDLLKYYMVDLSLTTRAPYTVHPALQFALDTLLERLEFVKAHGEQLVLMLPTGWDSHVLETAPCGKWVDGHEMGKNEANKCRFKDSDLSYFYEQLLTCCIDYKDSILMTYWGLEGGYDPLMYEKQIGLLLEAIHKSGLHTELAIQISPTLG